MKFSWPGLAWYQRGCVPERWAPVSAAMHYLKTLIQRRLQGTPFVTPSGAPSVSELRRSRWSRDRGGQVDRGDVDRCEGGGGLVTEELCQRESEGQNLHLFLSGHSKP